jgi:MFS family permease
VTGPARLSPTVRGLALVSLFNDFASEMVYPLLPAFVTTVLGGGAVALGALDGAADFTSAVLKWVSGRLADRRGWRKPLVLAGYATAVLVRPLIAFAGSAGQVIGFRVVDRVGKGLRTPPRDALIAESTSAGLHGRAFGFHRGADHLGAVLGSVAAWWFLSRAVDVRRVIEWSAFPGIVVVLVLAVVLREPTPAPADTPAPAAPAPAGRVFWGPVGTLAAFALFRIPDALLLLRMQQLGVAIPLIPLLWAGLHVVRTVASYPGGWLNDRLGAERNIVFGAVVFAALMFGLSVQDGIARSVACFLALGIATGLTEPAERALVARLSPKRLGKGFGGYHALTGLAVLPAALLFGVAYARSAAAALAISGALSLAAAAAWPVVARRAVRPRAA